MEKNKIFKAIDRDEQEKEFIFKVPTSEDLGDADMYYASKIAKMVRKKGDDKLLLRCEVDEFLKEQGIWNEKDQNKVNELNDRINDGLATLKQGGIKLSEGRSIAIKITEARQELVKVMKKRQIFDNATIEAIADDEKVDYLIYACTVNSDSDERYWQSFEDMKEDRGSDVYRAASEASIETLYGIDSDFEKNLPENKWLKKYNFIDESLTFVDRKTGEYVDKEGRPLTDVQEDILSRLESLSGEIKEAKPFIDDYENPGPKKKKTTRKRKTTRKKVEA